MLWIEVEDVDDELEVAEEELEKDEVTDDSVEEFIVALALIWKRRYFSTSSSSAWFSYCRCYCWMHNDVDYDGRIDEVVQTDIWERMGRTS